MTTFNASAMVAAIREEMDRFGVPEAAFYGLPHAEFSALLWLLDRDWAGFQRVLASVKETEAV